MRAAVSLVWLLTILNSLESLWAATIQLETQRIGRAEISRVSMVGFAGVVELIPVKGAQNYELQVAIEKPAASADDESVVDWDIKFKVENKEYWIEVTGPQNKETWRRMVGRNTYPKYRLKLLGPPVPVSLSWRELKLSSVGWASEIRAQAVQGEYLLQQGRGDLVLSLDRGKINVSEQAGSLDVAAFQAEVMVQNLDGSLKLHNFSGMSKVTRLQGDLNLKARLGVSKVDGVTGGVLFDNGKGALSIVAAGERLAGATESGSVKVEVKEKVDVRIKSKDGFVTVLTPPNSGAMVNVGSIEGDLFVPNTFKVERVADLKVASGRLPGAAGGLIHVRTETAGVKVR